jgi:hypothetical protein
MIKQFMTIMPCEQEWDQWGWGVLRTLYCPRKRWRYWFTLESDKLNTHVAISRETTKEIQIDYMISKHSIRIAKSKLEKNV